MEKDGIGSGSVALALIVLFLSGMSKDDAKAAYIEIVQTLLAKYPH